MHPVAQGPPEPAQYPQGEEHDDERRGHERPATSAHAMKSWQNGLPRFLPAQYCARKENHSQSFESCAISLPRSTVGA